MAQITSREQLEAWLKDKPHHWAQVIAARAALTSLPRILTGEKSVKWLHVYMLDVFQCAIVAWASSNLRDLNFKASIEQKNDPYFMYGASYSEVKTGSTYSLANAAFEAIIIATDLIGTASEEIYPQALDVVMAAEGAYEEVWRQVSADCERLENLGSVIDLTQSKLWPETEPEFWNNGWKSATIQLLTLDPTYQVWIDWYNRRIEGHAAAFDIPGDTNRKEDKAILARLADATNEDFWDKGATYVNTTLQSWIDEARARIALSPRPTKAEVQAAVVKYASPDARIFDDRLDAGPNAIFDKPRYDGDLATLPSQLRAFTGALSASLPRNAPDVIRHCLSAYSDELLVRGTQPIVSIVKGMASAIATQVWITPGDAGKDNPDAWVLKDPREWEPGTADLFRTFFKAHLDLITHFPLDPEREAMLAATPIDEVAASDKALTDPIDRVTDLIITLAKDGHATDNIVRIVKALADYTRDIAGMPKPDEARLPSTTITPKRRHVLQTAGFYLHAYSILGTTAQLATLPQVQALMAALADAAERLMGFIL
jgi:hypothetical protein